MKCTNCQAEWTPPVRSSVLLITCPFCGASLIKEKAGSSLENTLQTIYEQIGEAGMRNGNRLISYFLDFAPSMKKEAKMLSLFVKCGGNTTLLDVKKSNGSEVKAAAERVVFKMTEELMAEEHCKMICAAYCFAIGCGPVWQTDKDSGKATPAFASEIMAAPKAELSGSITASKSPARAINFPPEFIVEGTTLTGYRGASTHLVVPDGITEIGAKAFAKNGSIRSITLPATIRHIRDKAFYQSLLTEINLPDGLESIGNEAFYWVPMRQIHLPPSLRSLGTSCFDNSQLTSVTVPGSVGVIPDRAFYGCTKLETAVLQEGITEIGDEVFNSCYVERPLRNITLPSTLKHIRHAAFFNCSSLTAVNLPHGLESIGENAFGCSGIRQIRLPSSLRTLGGSCFSGSRLTDITVPGAVGVIPESAFAECSRLESVVLQEGITEIGDNAFSDCPSLKSISIPDSITHISRFDAECRSFLGCNIQFVNASPAWKRANPQLLREMVPLPIDDDNFEMIEDEGLLECYYGRAEKPMIPASVSVIGGFAFSKNLYIRELILPEGVTEILGGAFSDCKALFSIRIPASLESVDDDAFGEGESMATFSKVYVSRWWAHEHPEIMGLEPFEDAQIIYT